MIVGRKKCFGLGFLMIVQIFNYGPCDRNAIIRTGPPSNFIHDDQGLITQIIQNAGGFCHFDHEGGLSSGQVV